MRSYIHVCGALALTAACSGEEAGDLGQLSPDAMVPERLDFGEVPLGTSRRLELTIQNVGDIPLRVSAIVPDDDFVNETHRFAIDTAPFDVLPGAAQTLDVDFTPLADEERDEVSGFTIEWNLDTPGRVIVQGRGVGARLEVDPTPVEFGNVLWGSSRTLDVVVTSRHDVPVDVFTRLDGQGNPVFEVVEGAGRFSLDTPVDADRSGALTADGAPLTPDSSLQVSFTYRAEPDQDAARDVVRWTVATCAPSICGEVVRLSGTPRPDAFDCQPSMIDFGGVEPGERVVATSTCTNVVGEPVVVEAVALETGPQGFEIKQAPSMLTFGADEQFSVRLAFSPPETALGNTLERAFAVRHRKVGGDEVQPTMVKASGRVGRPSVDLPTDRLTFPLTVISTRSRRALTVFNRGRAQLSVTIGRDGPFRAEQEVLQIGPESSATTDITFLPTELGPVTGTLQLTTNDPRRPELTLDVSGEGSGLPPCSYTLTPSQVTFGVVGLGESSEGRFVIENPGPGPCLINDVRVEGDPAFSVTEAPSDGSQLAAATSTAVLVSFSPTDARGASAALRFYISSSEDSNPSVPIDGRGTIDPLAIEPSPVVLYRTSACAEPEAQVTIVNPFRITETITSLRVEGDPLIDLTDPNGGPVTLTEASSVQFGIVAGQGSGDRATLVIETDQRGAPYRIPIEVRQQERLTARFSRGVTEPLDILFVVGDDQRYAGVTGVIPAEAERILDGLTAASVDYRLGVLRARMTDPSCPAPPPATRPLTLEQGICGYLADGGQNGVDPAWRVVTPQTAPTPRDAFGTTLLQPTRSGVFRPQAFQAVRQSLLPPLGDTWNAPFRRPDAALAVVIIAAGDDTGLDLRPEAVAPFLRTLGTGPVMVSVVAGPRQLSCFRPGLFAEASPRLVDAATASGGIAIEICSDAWGTPLVQGGLPVVGLRRNFQVDPPADPMSIEVRVDSATVATTDPTTNETVWTGSADGVLFARTPTTAMSVEISYRPACL